MKNLKNLKISDAVERKAGDLQRGDITPDGIVARVEVQGRDVWVTFTADVTVHGTVGQVVQVIAHIEGF